MHKYEIYAHTHVTHKLYFVLSENDPSSLLLLSDLRKYPFFSFKKDMNKLPIKKKEGYEQVFFVKHGTKLVL